MKVVHIIAGLSGILSGVVALYALKGGKVHRKSGMIFVYAMLIMASTGAILAALRSEYLNVVAGLLALYLVMTALFTVRRPTRLDWVNAGTVLLGLTVSFASVTLGVKTLNSDTGVIDGVPPAIPFIFGGVALLAVSGDVRAMASGGIKGARRIARHLWRMCFSLWIAIASLFLGQPQVFPKPVRTFPLLVIPPLLVLLVMTYWLIRVLIRKRRSKPKEIYVEKPD